MPIGSKTEQQGTFLIASLAALQLVVKTAV